MSKTEKQLRIVFYVVFAAVLLGSLATSSFAYPPKYFGYYWADSEWYGHYMDKVVITSGSVRLYDYTNVIQIDYDPSAGEADARRAIIDAANLGYKIILGGWCKFNYCLHNPDGSLQLDQYGNPIIDPNRTTQWNDECDYIASLIDGYEQYILALYLIDEPEAQYVGEWNTRARQEELVTYVKGYFNGSNAPVVPVAINYNNPTGVVASNLDIVMLDYYINAGGVYTTQTQFNAGIENYVSSIRSQAPGKPIIILGDSFSHSPSNKLAPTLAQQQWYYDYVCNQSDIIGLLYFMLADWPGGSIYGAIGHQDWLTQHKGYGDVVKPREPVKFSDRFDSYTNQQALQAVYSGTLPTLTTAKDHGSNGGKCVAFGSGQESATRRISTLNRTGSVSAFVYDSTHTSGGLWCFGARSNSQSVSVYARGTQSNFFINDSACGVFGLNTGVESLSCWQKVEFVFSGRSVTVYIDSKKIYESSGGWQGGYSQIEFADPENTSGIGYVDDIKCCQIKAPVKNDYDGDKRSDIVVYHPTWATYDILHSSDNFHTMTTTGFGNGGGGDKPVTGDYDGDGVSDVALWRWSEGTVWFIRSSNDTLGGYYITAGQSGDIPMSMDYDGDEISDPAIYRPSTATFYILRSASNYTMTYHILGDPYTATPVSMDYDGDGKTDPAIYVAANAVFYILLSGSNYATTYHYLGDPYNSVPVSMDYDGDGKADPAIYQPAYARFTVLLSGSNYATVSHYLGNTNYTPMAGDYDGDGKTDLVTINQGTDYIWTVLWSHYLPSTVVGSYTCGSTGMSIVGPASQEP